MKRVLPFLFISLANFFLCATNAQENVLFDSLYNEGISARKSGEFDQSLAHFHSVLQLGIKTFGEKSDKLANVYNSIGLVYKQQGKYPAQIENQQLAIECFQNADTVDQFRIAVAHYNLNQGYYSLGDFDNQIKAVKTALKIWQELGDSSYQWYCYNDIGTVSYTL